MVAMLGVIAVLGLLASTVTLWARAVLFDSSTVAAAAERALQDAEVVNALADYLSDELFTIVDLAAWLEGVLPDDLDALAPAIVGGIRSLVHDRLSDLLSEESTRALLVRSVERSHAAAMRLLEGDGLVDGVTIRDEEVSINLLPLIGRGLAAVQEAGFLADVAIPVLDPADDPEVHRAQLQQAFGRELGPDAGQLVVYRSESLSAAGQRLAVAQQAVVLVKRSMAVILVVTASTFAATLLFARSRRRTLVTLLLGSSVAFIGARLIIASVIDQAPGLVLTPGGRAAIASVLSSFADGLFTAITVVVVISVISSVIAFVAGPSDRALSLRRRAGSFRA